MDAITIYMNNNKVSKSVQERVKRWMNYTWENQNTFDENKALEFLPPKMRTDIAMRVHFATLGKNIYDIDPLFEFMFRLRHDSNFSYLNFCRQGKVVP